MSDRLTERDLALEEQRWKDPEWVCPQCKWTNMGIREICRNCGFDSAVTHAGCC